MKHQWIMSSALILLVAAAAHGQQAKPAGDSHKYRTIFTIAGAAGGFATGFLIGFDVFDDAVNSDRKLWTASVVGAGAGGVGGYFIGKALDNRRNKTTGIKIWRANLYDVQVAPVVSPKVKAVSVAVRF
jgi:hypothetical protein